MRYREDTAERTFAPQVVFHSSINEVYVAGVQITNPAKPFEGQAPHTFEVGRIRSRVGTDEPCPGLRPLDRWDECYRRGIICPG